MKKYLFSFFILAFGFTSTTVFAGNPDRQGEAGAAQLLINPWARSSGLHSMTTANISGVEAMRVNVAGVVRINSTQVIAGHTRYLEGADIGINTFGFAQKIGSNGAIGVSIMAMDLGDVPVTTEQLPEGTGATFSPNIFNLGVSYAHLFENKVSVGVAFRAVSEGTSDVGAFGFAIDAGVQYVTGPQDNFRFGISLRNIGTPMTFTGQGLSEVLENPDGTLPYTLSYFQRSQQFELPSLLNIGMGYDFYVGTRHVITAIANFTANSFSQDFIGGGLEYAFNKQFMVRAGYRREFGPEPFRAPDTFASIETGLAAGATIAIPLRRNDDGEVVSNLAIDYGYRSTDPFDGIHNISVRIDL